MSRNTKPSPRRMSAREIRAAIYLSGLNGDYQVHHNIQGEAIMCHVSQAAIGHAIVNGLRERQYEKIRNRRGMS